MISYLNKLSYNQVSVTLTPRQAKKLQSKRSTANGARIHLKRE